MSQSQSPQERPMLILGAGPAGLAAALELGPQALVLEARDEPGGLCRSFQVGQATFDYGGHAFFTRDQEVLDLLEGLAAEPLYRQPRAAWVWSHARFLPYPFQANLAFLPEDVVEDCLVGLTERSGPSNSNLDAWLEGAFGCGLHRHFLKPYNAKVWAYPLEQIEPRWVGERVVLPDAREIVRGALRSTPFTDFPNAEVRYPARGGFYELYRPLYDRVAAQVRLGRRATRLSLAQRTAWCGDEPFGFEDLISTMPLNRLVEITEDAPDEVRQAAGRLEANSLLLVSLELREADDRGMHRIYCADPQVMFHKLVLNQNSSATLRAAPVKGAQAEISFSRFKPLSPDEAVDNTVRALIDMGVIQGADAIGAVDVRTVEQGYPVYTPASLDAAAFLCGFYESRHVHPVGRFGEWAYINSDTALRRGLDVGRHLKGLRAGPLPRLHQPAVSRRLQPA